MAFARIKAFENAIDKIVLSHPIFEYEAFESARMILTFQELGKYQLVTHWEGAVDILIPMLFKNCTAKKDNLSVQMVSDTLEMFDSYRGLRELFYYSYNFPESTEWTFSSPTQIKITYKDNTIPLQLWYDQNKWFVKSHTIFKDYKEDDVIFKKVLNIEKEFKESQALNDVYAACLKEAELKLANYTNYLTDEVSFHSYTMKQFREVYLDMTARSLVARHFTKKYLEKKDMRREVYVRLPRSDLIKALVKELNADAPTIEAILNDMTYDKEKALFGLSFSSFPILFDSDHQEYNLFPQAFAISNYFSEIRRLWAKQDSEKYNSIITPVLDSTFSLRVQGSFTKSGFLNAKLKVKVSDYLSGLPDIDLLVVTIEPTGYPDPMYVILICELKNPMSEDSAKAFVASAGKKGHLTKAKTQLQRLQKLPGLDLRSMLQRTFPKLHFGIGAYLLNYLVITPHNIGMLTNMKELRVYDHEMIDSALKVAKGDIAVFFDLLNRERWLKSAEDCYSTTIVKKVIGDFSIELPEFHFKRMMAFGY